MGLAWRDTDVRDADSDPGMARVCGDSSRGGRVNYFPFNVGDYTAHTAHLEPMEDLAYRRCIDLYYLREGALPVDPMEVARLIRLRAHAADVEAVLHEFFTLTDAGWTQSRCDKEIAKFRLMAEGGKRGAEKRWLKGSDSPPIAPPSPPHDYPIDPPIATNNQEPLTNNQEEKEISPAARVSKSKGERLDAGWELPKAWGDWAQSSYPHWEAPAVRVIALGFRNHWVAKTGKDATKLDWYGTWQNWCMSDITQRAHPPPTTSVETVYQRSMRERMEQVSPSIAARRPGAPLRTNPMEIIDGLTRIAC